MKEFIIEYKDIVETKEIISNETPKYMVWFIYINLFILISSIVWMYFSEVEIVVKAMGVVRPVENVSTIMNISSGKIKQIFFMDGKQVKKGEVLYLIDSQSFDMQKQNVLKELEKNGKELEQLRKLEESIKSETNHFDKLKETEFYNRYITYRFKVSQLKLNMEQAKKRYNQEVDLGLGFTTKSRMGDLENEHKSAEMYFLKEQSETMSNLQNEILTKKNQRTKLENEIRDVDKNIGMSSIVAPIDGTIQIIKSCNVGEYITQGIEVLKIIPDSQQNLKIEADVQNKDIGQVKIGQKIQNSFLAFPFKEYGKICGEITKISGDANTSKGSEASYKIEGTIDKTVLIDKKGNEGKIKPGMISEVRIVTRKKRFLLIVLEKLDFIGDI